MYYKFAESILYRDFKTFGYITDNRNYTYQMIDDNKEMIGDRIVSQSGNVFLLVLSSKFESIDSLAKKAVKYFDKCTVKDIIFDMIDFYSELEKEGFVCSSESLVCNSNSKIDKSVLISSENDSESWIENYYKNNRHLKSVHIEITSMCNEHCVHCYISDENRNYNMSKKMLINILDQCKELNVLNITISGGEPLLHPNIIEFLNLCTKYNFSVNILTNLTVLSDEILNTLKNNKLICVQTSVYSMKNDIHDSITTVKGSLEKTLTGIEKILRNNIPIQISCPILRQNKNDYRAVREWAKLKKINVVSDYMIIGELNHKSTNVCNRLLLEDIEKYIREEMVNDNFFDDYTKELKEKNQILGTDCVCSICKYSICISEKGIVYPCVAWQSCILGDLNIESLSNIWNNSKELKKLRSIKVEDFKKCKCCSSREHCTICMARNANESISGDPFEINEFYCKVSKLKKKIYSENSRKLIKYRLE